MRIEEFHYRVPWRAGGAHPGHHAGTQVGGGYEFRGYLPLLNAPDPRRFDIRASLRDPFEQILVRVFSQRSAIPVYAIADLSASMSFVGRIRKLDLLADFVQSLGYSAYRTGDPFGFVGCDSEVRQEFVQPLSRAKAAGQLLGSRLREFVPRGTSSRGLLEAVSYLRQTRSIVFLLSDFHLPLELLRQMLRGLGSHTVVPVVFWDSAEFELPAWGLARLHDPETGAERTLFLRPALRARLVRAFEERRGALAGCLAQAGLRPLFIVDRFRADDVTRHFYQ